jgi:AcrR family transcriptional regulator
LSIAYDATDMSPARPRTSRDAVTVAARAILEREGLDAVTMQAVAERVGVKAPSLYKHVSDRADLIRTIVDSVAADLTSTLTPGPDRHAPADELRATARRYRTFVRENPTGYGLLFARLAPDMRPPDEALAGIGRPIVALVAQLVGDDEALASARTFVAWAHGFTSLEGAGGFRLGGDVDRAYETGVEVVLAGISERASQATT